MAKKIYKVFETSDGISLLSTEDKLVPMELMCEQFGFNLRREVDNLAKRELVGGFASDIELPDGTVQSMWCLPVEYLICWVLSRQIRTGGNWDYRKFLRFKIRTLNMVRDQFSVITDGY